jgi:hypothetical protein
VLPPGQLISKAELEAADNKVVAGKQFFRTPYIVSFQCGWFKFDLCAVHLYYGEDNGAKLQERIDEIKQVASYLAARADDAFLKDKSLILLGNFNIVGSQQETRQALLQAGFIVPENLRRETNSDLNKCYDQIAFKTTPDSLLLWIRLAKTPNRPTSAFSRFTGIVSTAMTWTFTATSAFKRRMVRKPSAGEKNRY